MRSIRPTQRLWRPDASVARNSMPWSRDETHVGLLAVDPQSSPPNRPAEHAVVVVHDAWSQSKAPTKLRTGARVARERLVLPGDR